MCSKTEFNPPFTPLLKRHRRVTKIAVYRYLSFFVILIVVYSPILALAPTLIQIAHAVHAHTQFR